MSIIKSGWTYIGRVVGWVLVAVVYLDLIILLIWLAIGLIVALGWGELAAPPIELGLILLWIPWAMLVLLGVAFFVFWASLVLLVVDSLINFVVNLVTSSGSPFTTLWNDLKAGARRAIDGVKDGFKDGVKAALTPIRAIVDWLRS
jgi:hypothetical protein